MSASFKSFRTSCKLCEDASNVPEGGICVAGQRWQLHRGLRRVGQGEETAMGCSMIFDGCETSEVQSLILDPYF